MIETLKNMIAALEQLEVKGKQNHIIIIACLKKKKKMLKEAEECQP